MFLNNTEQVSESFPSRSTSLHTNNGLIGESEPIVRPSDENSTFMGIISQSLDMRRVFDLIKKVSKSQSTVLVLGESGTGKELVAQAIHKLSKRPGKLVPVNCGAIPEEILESELFGHEKGSFTGAIASRVGRFQMAEGGTIFLDEIGEMSPKLQVKLLRVLQERKVEPVGSTRSIDVDVRVIAATNKDLREEVKAGRFREDLYYRLQVVPIELSPLRERGTDSLILAKHFIDKYCNAMGKDLVELSPEVQSKFLSYAWPGNVRELENLIERMVVLSDGGQIGVQDLPEYFAERSGDFKMLTTNSEIPSEGLDFNTLVDDFETRLITMAMSKTNGNKKAAARLLNLNRTTLVEKIKKKGLYASIEITSDSSI